MSLPIKAVTLDLDGTMLRPDGSIHPDDIQVARSLKKQGVHIWIASGRHLNFIKPFIRAFGPECIDGVVACSGACVYLGTGLKLISQTPIPDTLAEDFLSFMQNTHSNGSIYTQELPFYRFAPKPGMPIDKVLLAADKPLYEYGRDYSHLEDYRRGLGGKILKFAVIGQPVHTREAFCKRFSPLSLCLYTIGNDAFSCEVMPPGINKTRGVTVLAEQYGISMDEVLALGDSNNDLDLLEACGFGAVPSNAQILQDGTVTVLSEGTACFNDKKFWITNDNDSAPLMGILPRLQQE